MAQNTDEIVAKYVALRDRKSELKRAYDLQVAEIDQAQETIEVYLMQLLTSLNVESLSATAGTVYKSTTVKAKIADREEARKFVLKTKNLDLLELRASSSGVKQYLQEHGKLPEGFEALTEQTVNVRRA